jgi:PPK2 family polyphosphate:nucleotide phosphotransferase
MTLEAEDSEVTASPPRSFDPKSFPKVDAARYRVKPGSVVDLGKIDTRAAGDFDGDKQVGKAMLPQLTKRIGELQEILYAQGKHRLLVVLQATDTGGKDGTISHVFDNVNPQGVKVASFKTPTSRELAHDFLWRIHPHVPGNGEIAVFNRSHYEDVLIVRVHKLISKAVCHRRFEHINAFERMLADEGTTILKFYLHISKDEQKERLQARIDDPSKHWKFEPADLDERKRWDEYRGAAEEMMHHTSTKEAPWFIVPADRKWYRNLVVSQAIISSLEGLKLAYPEPKMSLDGIVVE